MAGVGEKLSPTIVAFGIVGLGKGSVWIDVVVGNNGGFIGVIVL